MATTKLAVKENSENLELIKQTVAKGTTDEELRLFMYTAHKTGLDPLVRQIHCVKRKNKQPNGEYKEVMTIQIGIDGYRSIAARTGELAGIDDAVFDSEDGDHPNKATVTVWRLVKGTRVAFTASARWNEFAQMYTTKEGVKPMAQWASKPYLMLAKCAESTALRKGFPQELAGVYTEEELPTIEVEPASTEAAVTYMPPVVSKTEIAAPVEEAICSTCSAPVHDAVKMFSLSRFGKVLCREHQVKPAAPVTQSETK